MKKQIDIKRLVTLGLLLAAEVILSRFLSIATPIVKIGFAFVPVVVTAILYGPVWSAVVAGAGDFIGAILFPIGPFFPGYTISAAISGAIFGIILYNKKPGILRSFMASSLSLLICSLILDTLWIWMTSSTATAASLLPTRLLKFGVMLVIETVTVFAISKQETIIKRIKCKTVRYTAYCLDLKIKVELHYLHYQRR